VGFLSIFTRAVTAVATGGGSEIARLVGGPSAGEQIEQVFAPTTPQGVATVGTLAVTGSPTAAAAVGGVVGQLARQTSTPIFVQNQPPTFAPSTNRRPVAASVGGGAAAFSSFRLPPGPGGGNPAWRSLGSSGVSFSQRSGFLDVGGARWAVSRHSVRRL